MTAPLKDEKKADPSRLANLLEAKEQAYETLAVLEPEVQALYEKQLSLLNDEINSLIEAGKSRVP